MEIRRRLNRLENAIPPEPECEPALLVLVYGETGQPNEAQLERAKAEYRREHPGWRGNDFMVLWVTSGKAKEAVETVAQTLSCSSRADSALH